MTRKPAPRWMRRAAAAASWIIGAALAQGAFGSDIGAFGRRLEERIELRLKGGGPSVPGAQPERTHEDAIEPWELVSV